jgi:hypothetical protein
MSSGKLVVMEGKSRVFFGQRGFFAAGSLRVRQRHQGIGGRGGSGRCGAAQGIDHLKLF